MINLFAEIKKEPQILVLFFILFLIVAGIFKAFILPSGNDFRESAYACPEMENAPKCYSVTLDIDGDEVGKWINGLYFSGGTYMELNQCSIISNKVKCIDGEFKTWYIELKN